MKRLSELKDEIEKMISIWNSADTYFKDNMYLLNPETIEEKTVAEYDLFIKRAKYAVGVMSILQINKLFGGENDDFSLNKFLNKLLNSHRNSEWKEKLSIQQIEEWQKTLGEKIMVDSIKKVNGLRDQYYAHSDRNPEVFENLIVKSEEMKNLLKFCEDVLLKISVDVFQKYYWYPTIEKEKASGILMQLSVHVKKI